MAEGQNVQGSRVVIIGGSTLCEKWGRFLREVGLSVANLPDETGASRLIPQPVEPLRPGQVVDSKNATFIYREEVVACDFREVESGLHSLT